MLSNNIFPMRKNNMILNQYLMYVGIILYYDESSKLVNNK